MATSDLPQELQQIIKRDVPLNLYEPLELNKILTFLQTQATQTQKHILLENIGDFARQEGNRTPLGDNQAVEIISQILLSNKEDLIIQRFATRALANLCYEHVENRDKVHKNLEIIKFSITLLSSTNEAIRMVAAGSLTNFSFESEEAQKAVVNLGAVEPLVSLLNDQVNNVKAMVCSALINLTKNNESSSKIVLANNGIELITQLLNHEQDNVRSAAINLLGEIIGFVYESLKENFIKVDFFNKIIEFIKTEEETELREILAHSLQKMAGKDFLRPLLQPFLNQIFDMVHQYSDVRNFTMYTLGYLSIEDSNTDFIFSRIQELLQYSKQTEFQQLISIAMMFGNLARTTSYCKRLIELGAIDLCIEFLKMPDSRLHQYALGTLRNLAILEDNKHILIERGVMRALISTLRSLNGHVLFANFGLLRHLISITETAAEIFTSNGGMDLLCPFLTELQDEHYRLIYESSRVIAALVLKVLNVEPVLSQGGDRGLVKLIDSKYDLLQTEGLQAILKISTNEIFRGKLANNKVQEPLIKLALSENVEIVNLALGCINNFIKNNDCKSLFPTEKIIEIKHSIKPKNIQTNFAKEFNELTN
eukprot:TRINITY_DN2830_c0_g1_i1.p1 TRINITY_DN2830_c0_g1~~TRINITY_DN2830_c0_g1_i1.p1  ORF type:complete len:595 (+),score=238.78 TRINITY_DN2830_c0_g1_i1:62-1846(+)